MLIVSKKNHMPQNVVDIFIVVRIFPLNNCRYCPILNI